jgi:hypothetical protein
MLFSLGILRWFTCVLSFFSILDLACTQIFIIDAHLIIFLVMVRVPKHAESLLSNLSSLSMFYNNSAQGTSSCKIDFSIFLIKTVKGKPANELRLLDVADNGLSMLLFLAHMHALTQCQGNHLLEYGKPRSSCYRICLLI